MKSDEQVLAELKEAIAGLTFMSESDHPFEVVRWDGADEVSPEYLRRIEGQPAAAPVRTESLDEFFGVAAAEAGWKSAAELATARRYQALVKMLRENLSDVAVYRIGAIDIRVYVVGRHATGGWLGVSTRVIET